MLHDTECTSDCRYADDAAMNKELREVDRWNDPAQEFLSVSNGHT